MDEVWERAVETALDGQTDCSSARSLTLDGVVKCLHGRLPPPSLLEKFQALEHLSIANIGLSSLDKFPRLPNLQKLILSDNRIAGGLEFLVQAGLASLRDLDLSNNRIQFVEDLAPLSHLKLVSLDLYECPVTRVKDYRSRVFALIRSLKYLDKMDADHNERPESEDEEEEEEEDDDDEDDPGSGEIDGGEDRAGRSTNGGRTDEGVVDADDDEESDADEEETATNGSERPQQQHLTNGFRVAAAAAAASSSLNGEDDEEDAEDEEEDDLGEEIDEDDGEDEDVIEVHEIEDSDEDEDGVEEDEDDEDDEDEDEEDVEDEEEAGEPGSTGRLTSTEGEIDGHDQGEEDENGEIGEEDDQGIEEEGEYEEDDGEGEDEVRFLTSHPLFHLHPSYCLLLFFFYINALISAIVNQLPFKYFMLAHTWVRPA